MVDLDDFDKIKDLHIHTTKCNSKFTRYVVCGTKSKQPLTHLIMGIPPVGKIVDHIDGNGYNNRKSNLRIVNYSVQAYNRKNTKNTSGVTGVNFDS